ncbi:MAG TPA: VOC family protein [Leptolyngbyaceae cyanobacterium M65_K2018_010]|nr:VOC family protein [Leptolyngbyaceae cyanobacterium M65_K2018_010]
MNFNHLTLFVNDVALWRDRLGRTWGGQPADLCLPHGGSGSLLVLGQVPLVLTAPHQAGDGAALYLQRHPPGVGDVAFRVNHLEQTLKRVLGAGGTLLEPVQMDPYGRGRWCQIQGWGHLRHTLVESQEAEVWVPGQPIRKGSGSIRPTPSCLITGIDHAVINLPAGQMQPAIAWYVEQLGFQPQQQFTIDTPWSGLRSQVLAHPDGGAQLPINEPTTPNSQVQEFLEWHRGAGIQHVALHTSDILQTVSQLQEAGVTFLDVPDDYYTTLPQRPG